jgi:hypothetical protein
MTTNISLLMASNDITPDTDLSVLDNAVRLFHVQNEFNKVRTQHFINHKEWLPSYFEKEAEAFFGGRYTQEQLQECWLRADNHLHPNWEAEADAEYEMLTDEEKQNIEELADDLLSFIDERLARRDQDNSILAELAKEFE